ncbi:unnamed protein product [Zymoseptoria tritici ST99CH_1A5]|uniref:Uncharacterized protein n=4 Tax=Zymoseptoria tritici TaxID=1047171 RepID=F9WY24_ZYMTI|nr:uncharacterized protein MYCGRDRAFT_107313 [Zymoseptoria tritici IPO323]SMQ46060.1 unnamed protein product [Zymoseptoria tritici ST99CH_3D7]SMR42406.1 unnamed protein product [Zymoseptoria tritici ST99CH_1E4]SMR44583.1 unnamed protein product [Zymoseptoria tritici ST99CH_3D1]SMY19745.1 unnamed protein product [Zymoseptoria tritici ST99CH_1A5]EGP92267.1 hypothetical protein MYCGRDRAFT_107313 [Zymoseptoria tritici IPO323]
MDSPGSPPLTPIRAYMTPIETSPTSQYRDTIRRRNSSFSSYHGRSPTTPKSRNRISGASHISGEFGLEGEEGSGGAGGNGLGNLADELDQLSDEEDFDEGATEEEQGEDGNDDEIKDEASRDSGIDVSYRNTSTHTRNFSKPFSSAADQSPTDAPPPEDASATSSDDEMRFSLDLEDALTSIARMASSSSTSEDPLIPRFITHLQDLGNQSSLESAAQRLTTSTNSATTHLNTQTKTLQTLLQTIYPPIFAFAAGPLDPAVIEETLPLLETLHEALPLPDVVAGQKLQKLDRETADVILALGQITDSLQMGKQATTQASRCLRNTQGMVLELRREREAAGKAREELERSGWGEKLEGRWCGQECRDILEGFEEECKVLRGSLERMAVVEG